MRQVNLSTVLVFRRVANKVLARFPTYRSLVDAGLMMPHEATYLTDIDSRYYTFYNAHLVVSIEFSPLSTVELTTNWYQLHNGDYLNANS